MSVGAAGPALVDDREGSRFALVVEGEVAGHVTYKRRRGVLSLLHTEIAPEFGGRGLGTVLARAVLEAARQEGADVLPFCPFLRAYLQRHPEDVDLVPAVRRASFGLSGVAPAPGAPAAPEPGAAVGP